MWTKYVRREIALEKVSFSAGLLAREGDVSMLDEFSA